jgi:hypothetical protein
MYRQTLLTKRTYLASPPVTAFAITKVETPSLGCP